jgi:hypothetical protein
MCISRNQPDLAAAKVLQGKAVVLNNMCRNGTALLYADEASSLVDWSDDAVESN